MEYANARSDCDIAVRQIGYKWYAVLITYYIVLSSFFISYYRHEMDADGISYISLAQKYLSGDFGNAVNGYWSPMISWVIAPFMSLGLEPIIAFRTASILFGIMTLVGIDKLMTEIEISSYTRLLYLMSLSPVVAWYAENDVGADLLGACVLLHYIHAILRDEYQNKKFAGIACGMLGTLAYLAKNYNFYFFVLHFSCINACYWKQSASSSQKKIIAFNFICALAVFVLLTGIWIGLVSEKYHTLTMGTAGSYTFSHIRPGHSTSTHPMLTDGFMPPPNSTALSTWEDPTYIKLTHWSPFRSARDFLYYLKFIPSNIYKYLSGLAINYIFDLTIVYLIINLFFLKKRLNKKTLYILLTILIYPLGYFALYYEGQRYIILNQILLYILSSYVVNLILIKYRKSITVKAWISAVLCVSLIVLTMVRIKHDGHHINELNDIFHVSTQVETYYNMHDVNIASQDGNWNPTLNLSYFLKARYFGKARDDVTNEQLRSELLNYDIKYYFVYGRLKNHIDILRPERQFKFSTSDMTVYRVAEKPGS